MDYSVLTFSGGLSMDFEATKINPGQYPLLVNGRNRYGIIEPIRMPKAIALPMEGKLQGLYASDKWMILFISGRAFIKDCSLDLEFREVTGGFILDPNVDYIYACPVNAASVTFKRKLTTGSTKDITLTDPIKGGNMCIVCQDGINQPWVILPDGSSRVTNTYAQWTLDSDMEYVPIGKQMLFTGSKLYIVGADTNGRFTQIFHSVSGRPLDFMVNINSAGDKLPLESDGGASSVSHRVSYEEITAISDSDVSSGSFAVYTLKSTTMVTPDLTNTIFGEPTFTNVTTMETGVVNQFSIVPILNDTVFIDQTGIKSYNAVKQYRIEGNSNPFSSTVSPLFKIPGQNTNLIQTECCAHSTDNYALFSLETVYGNALVVYDMIREVFTGIDIYDTYKIKMFAEAKVSGSRFLYYITSENTLYEMYGSDDIAPCKLYLGEFCSQDPMASQKPQSVSLVFTNIYEQGTVEVSLYVDQVLGVSKSADILAQAEIPTKPIPLPFAGYTTHKSSSLGFNFQSESLSGWKVGFFIEWDFLAALSAVHVTCKDDTSKVPVRQQLTINAGYIPQVGTPIFQ